MSALFESEYGYSANNFHIERFNGDELHVTLTYPNTTEKGCRHVVFDQESVRASDGIRMHYDYERDGYVIEQMSHFECEHAEGDPACTPDWQEVAFIQAWAREKK